jgi:hypothetical protein
MQRDPFIIAFQRYQWVLSRAGTQLGTFRFRASALKGAVEALYWASDDREPVDVMVLDRNGSLYTAWKNDRDCLSFTH